MWQVFGLLLKAFDPLAQKLMNLGYCCFSYNFQKPMTFTMNFKAYVNPNKAGLYLLRKMRLMIILKVKERQGFTFSLEDTFFEKPQGGSS